MHKHYPDKAHRALISASSLITHCPFCGSRIDEERKTYKAVVFSSLTGIPRVVDVEFTVRENGYLYVTKGGVTGFESAPLEELLKNDYVFDCWNANMGTARSWSKMLIPIMEIRRFVEENSIKINAQ